MRSDAIATERHNHVHFPLSRLWVFFCVPGGFDTGVWELFFFRSNVMVIFVFIFSYFSSILFALFSQPPTKGFFLVHHASLPPNASTLRLTSQHSRSFFEIGTGFFPFAPDVAQLFPQYFFLRLGSACLWYSTRLKDVQWFPIHISANLSRLLTSHYFLCLKCFSKDYF